ncbi:hypothetical protein OK18_02025 [Chryseobacterium gallinarum]|uniref:Uncharacterized protein n=1 Tax=Chryseobacterium gallinarum TaxID=1324352 RepID=A0A0G3LYA6_CHRGL|nr:hypothetical protein [Chryseobacterium gallinarum]AKK71579.1 hypothetical protein OK18_02025 [Chryseobacterium gallinarum]
MDYLKYINDLESLQKNDRRWMYLQLLNIIKGISNQTHIEEFKIKLRLIYKEVLKTPNPIRMSDGSVSDEKALMVLDSLIISIIDLLNDYYGNYKYINGK